MRGDRPVHRRLSGPQNPFTPHARGSTVFRQFNLTWQRVYPACAGIDLSRFLSQVRRERLPRMRGDRPFVFQKQKRVVEFTPHARGSTETLGKAQSVYLVYPACAGIDLDLPQVLATYPCLPRMRGDRPGKWREWIRDTPFTPHARGSTSRTTVLSPVFVVYPACAGIDPVHADLIAARVSLPRMRGDRPDTLRLKYL